MAIKIGADGTLYCNTVKYNYKQARNMIADGCYGNISGSDVWNGLTSDIVSTNPAGYKSYRSFKLKTDGSGLRQNLPTFIANHKYYFSFYNFGNGASLNSAVQIRNSSGTTVVDFSVWGLINSWALRSTIFTPSSNIAGGYLYAYGYTNSAYLSRFILIDLTDTFGAGNEPTTEWCDLNIREQQTIINYGCISKAVDYGNYASKYTRRQVSQSNAYNYLHMNDVRFSREYFYELYGSSSYNECFLYSSENATLTNGNMHYGYFEYRCPYPINGQTLEIFFPEQSPALGQVPIVTNTEYNSGGGMNQWKRFSVYNNRSSFSSGSYNQRFDFNNMKETNLIQITALNIINAQDPLDIYNLPEKGEPHKAVQTGDINKEWCDRWIDGRSSPIIHIKDPNNTSIKFNTGYDVICNDIEIRPESNGVKFDKTTGTIICKKLIRTQAY